MMKNNLKKLKKFFKTKTGTTSILILGAPLLVVFVITWGVYLLNIASLNARSSSITTAEDTAPISVPTNIPLTVPAGTTNAKGYVASVCSKTSIPYDTVYVNDENLEKGKTLIYDGFDGANITCTADSYGNNASKSVVEPYDKIVHVGTWDLQAEDDSANTAIAAESAARAAQAAKEARDIRVAQCVSQVNSQFQVSNAGQSSAYYYAMQRCYSIQ